MDRIFGHGMSGARWEVYRRHAEFLTQLGMARAEAEEVVAPRVERLRLEAAHEHIDHLASIARLQANGVSVVIYSDREPSIQVIPLAVGSIASEH